MYNEYNSFNKYKGFFHRENFEAIIKGEFLPPYCVCTDPSNVCNENCVYCNSGNFRKKNTDLMPAGHLKKLASFYKDWGVKSTIIEGGGEPLINIESIEFIKLLKRYDLQIGLITNGVLLDTEYADLICESLRFCGISFDSANKETYKTMRGVDAFEGVTRNIKRLNDVRIKTNSSVDVNIKFLIHKYNYKEIYDFVKLAKDLGCNGVHIKPVAYENIDADIKKFDMSENIKEINDLILKSKELDDDNFSVHAIMYKFDNNFKKKVNFTKCECTPIGGVFAADGNFHLCVNMRGREGMILDSHFPDPYNIKRMWGSEYHKKLISQIDPNKCMRCGLSTYNEIIENCIRNDKLFKEFL